MQPDATHLPRSNLDAATRVSLLAARPDAQDAAALLPRVGIFRVLVCRPTHSLGNTLLLTPLLREIETIYPGAEIDIVSRTPVAVEVFGRFASVRRIFVLPSRPLQQLPRLINVLLRVRETRYDLVIDPSPHSPTSLGQKDPC